MKYPQVTHQVMIRHTRLGDYILSGESVLEIEESGKEIVTRCDGTHSTLLKSRNKTDNYLTDFIFCREQCSIGTTPVITPTGDVYPCMLTKYEQLKVGNVKKTSITSMYKNSSILKEVFALRVEDIDTCRGCWNRYYCGGGCRGCSFAYYNTIYNRDVYQCEARKKFARALLKRGHPHTKKALMELIALTKNQQEEPHG